MSSKAFIPALSSPVFAEASDFFQAYCQNGYGQTPVEHKQALNKLFRRWQLSLSDFPYLTM